MHVKLTKYEYLLYQNLFSICRMWMIQKHKGKTIK